MRLWEMLDQDSEIVIYLKESYRANNNTTQALVETSVHFNLPTETIIRAVRKVEFMESNYPDNFTRTPDDSEPSDRDVDTYMERRDELIQDGIKKFKKYLDDADQPGHINPDAVSDIAAFVEEKLLNIYDTDVTKFETYAQLQAGIIKTIQSNPMINIKT